MLSLPLSLLTLSFLGGSLASPYHVEKRANGCGQSPPMKNGNFKNYTMTDGREYRVWLPGTYDSSRATPLVLSYHGANGDMTHQVNLDKLTDPFFNTDYIMVYMQGTADDPDDPTHTTWEGAPGSTSNDIKYTTEVLDAVTEELCVDEKRIFATGKSQGGGFVGRLACDATLSRRIAAFAPVSGAYYIKEVDTEAACHPATVQVPCDAGRADVPVMAFHGGADTTIRYHGDFRSGACLPDVSSWARQWAARDGLPTTPDNSSVPGSDHGVNMRYGPRSLVTLVYDGDNVGHDWPATVPNSDNDGERIAAFNASKRIMDFFGGHPLP
ncbi:carbohydrate esterase family 1 protein [Hypoxylon sp. FL1284]|nr:carbohydrate esterase family 1 protein [Hypoxylon sp. FL1284]